jgi:hypothetical protein
MKTRRAYVELLLEHGSPLAYPVLLSTNEWEFLRNKVICRENNICQRCQQACNDGYMPKWVGGPGGFLAEVPYVEVWGTKTVDLVWLGEVVGQYDKETLKMVPMKIPLIGHVHHTYYVLTRLPWEYPLDDLQLLCHVCHTLVHDQTQISVYQNEEKRRFSYLTPCSRCHGTGHLAQYDHVSDGICFRCNGARFEEWQ